MKSEKLLLKFSIKIGDIVRHVDKGWIGIVADFQKRNAGILVNLSDHSGVKFRWIRREKLELVKEKNNG